METHKTESPYLQSCREVLQSRFGFSQFRPGQAEILDAIGEGKSVLGVLPTGLGKSLCYQIPSLLPSQGKPGLVLVVSPLIALMKDQVDAARSKGLQAAAINSSFRREERERVLKETASGGVKLLYATPERFRSVEFLEALKAAGGVRLLAVDEAHCISTWGHDFRLDYSRLGDRREELGDPQTVALTATASTETRADILRQLRLTGDNSVIVATDVWRENLAIEILETMGIDEKIRAFVMLSHLHPGPTIVYFSLIQTLRRFSEELDRLGLHHVVYHGQLQDRVRRQNQEQFLGGVANLMLATPAFGLGVDKANVRLLVHAEVPGSLESYYQEIGRAGRDGEPSACVLLYDRDDISIQSDFLKWGAPDPGFIQSVHNLIARNESRVRQEGFDYLRAQMNFYNSRDYRVETAVQLLERWGALEGREPREWKAVGEVPDELLDRERFAAGLKRRERKLGEMVEFSEAAEGCRMSRVTRAFGSEPGADFSARHCGVCDLCRGRPRDSL